MNSQFDFPMSEDWRRAYGLESDHRQDSETPTPTVIVQLVRQVYNLETMHTSAHFMIVEGDPSDPTVRGIARAQAHKRLVYMWLLDGIDISILRTYRMRRDSDNYFWVEYKEMETR